MSQVMEWIDLTKSVSSLKADTCLSIESTIQYCHEQFTTKQELKDLQAEIQQNQAQINQVIDSSKSVITSTNFN